MTTEEKATLERLKKKYQDEMECHSAIVNQYLGTYGNDNCDYLIYNRIMSNYYRGSWNALNELDRELNE